MVVKTTPSSGNSQKKGIPLWHIWMILPLNTVWRVIIAGGCLAAFLFLFLNFMPFLGKFRIGTRSEYVVATLRNAEAN